MSTVSFDIATLRPAEGSPQAVREQVEQRQIEEVEELGQQQRTLSEPEPTPRVAEHQEPEGILVDSMGEALESLMVERDAGLEAVAFAQVPGDLIVVVTVEGTRAEPGIEEGLQDGKGTDQGE